MNDQITIRPATIADVASLVRLRRAMFEAMGWDDLAQLDASDASNRRYFAEAIPAGAFHAWLAINSAGEAVASGGVVVDQHPPGPGNLSGRVGYIMNLVTDPRYRRQGIARRIMQLMIQWLTDRGIQCMALHATDVGRSLYEELGFVASNEMRLTKTQ